MDDVAESTAPATESTSRRTNRELMLSGELYRADCDELIEMRARARRLTRELNEHGLPGMADDGRPQREILDELFASVGDNPYIEPPFRCDYGSHISIGNNFYANYDCIMLDCAPIHIGDDVMLGPRVIICTAAHPVDPKLRNSGLEFAKSVRIGNGTWIGAGAIINPGVTIGEHVVIGSGSVVTRDLPDDVVAVGNPCRIIRSID